jgi:hypothetical protein
MLLDVFELFLVLFVFVSIFSVELFRYWAWVVWAVSAGFQFVFAKATDFDFTFGFGYVSFSCVVAEFTTLADAFVWVLGFLPLYAGFAVCAAATNFPNRQC